MCLELFSEIKLDSHLQGWQVLFSKNFNFLTKLKENLTCGLVIWCSEFKSLIFYIHDHLANDHDDLSM